MAGYSFMTINKVKDYGTLTAKYNHNCRVVDVSNAIPELADQNDTLVELPKSNNEQMGYAEAVKNRIKNLDYYKNHKVRSNAVLAYELVLTFTKDDAIDIEEWKSRTTQWLKDTFNIAPDGKDNVLHVVFHGDEVGGAHCHALVCPIDEKGHLNARRFTGGTHKMIELQTSYAKSVEDLGLQRGVHNSSAYHKDIARLYAELNNAIKIPERQNNEDIESYIERMKEHCQTWKASTKKQLDDNYRKKVQQLDSQRNDDKELINEELNKSNLIAQKLWVDTIKKTRKAEKERKDFVEERNAILAQIEKLKAYGKPDEIIEKSRKYGAIEKGLHIKGKTRPEDEIAIRNVIEQLMSDGGYNDSISISEKNIHTH